MANVYAFDYTGGEQEFIVPATGYYKLEVWGASGGTGYCAGWSAHDSHGAYVSGNIKLNRNSGLYVYVGQRGTDHTTLSSDKSATYNGGGAGALSGDGDDTGGAGGGATDVRVVDGAWNNSSSLGSRIMVAAGGGGTVVCYPHDGSSCSYKDAFNGGGLSIQGSLPTWALRSGTWSPIVNQTTGSSFGIGATGARGYAEAVAGGGGGWYGGQNYNNNNGTSGAGGTSYISGHTGSVAVSTTSSNSPKSGCTTGTTNNTCSITPYINSATDSGYIFTNTLMIDGTGYNWTNSRGSLQQMPNPSGGYYVSGTGHRGNGYAKITHLGISI